MKYYVYIMSSFRKILYIGVTNNLKRRVYEHQAGLVPGFTQKYQIKLLVYFEEYNNINQAIEREKTIKSWRREKKLNLIYTLNPYWDDLSKKFGFT
ncbi:MAG TPA: endonuclease [Candidatus Magasanikbacteria bacterium]|uniref:Excinuclease ABC subunit C n=1 Tax=Candidatus Magasanikbacteria bacterium GW2011_GWC2_41_17 TaxID=1619048 RepID=A0A0G0VGX8_9BACT|nr:MAG: Excinuclease ABC subunit C [Candidatus Magasanikbacteria bacterium GW2011_GWC2_41_17]HBV58384.1 endonuclease [Candidatus Magasanikbacteria bacterium]HBX15680.1 endonuclease [Candidatus Magasanikbacteria bacterium]